LEDRLVPSTLINFDDVPDGTVINSRYAGVTFNNPIGGNIYARSGGGFAVTAPNVVSVFASGFPMFNAYYGAVEAHFATPQSTVSIDARPVSDLEPLGTPHNRPFLEAYTATGTFLGSVLYTGPLPTGGSFEVGGIETLTFTQATADIGYVRFSSQQSQPGPRIFGLFDDLRYDDTLAATSLRVTAPANVPAGQPFSITVTALDASNHTVPGYTGTVHFASADPYGATLPADYTFTAADAGVHTFAAGAALYTAGTRDVTVTGTTIPAGIISWWPGDGDATDSVGGNNGTLHGGVTFAVGEVGQAFNLNGVNAYVDFGSAPALNVQDFTLDAWVSVDPSQNTGERRVISRDDIFVEGSEGRQLYTLKSSSNAGGQGCPRMEILKDGVFSAVTAPAPLTAGFHHLAGIRSGNALNLYVDGVLVASTTTTITGVLSPNASLVLGQVSPAYNGEFFQGLADEVDLFNRALSPSEIQGIFAAGAAGKHLTITGTANVNVGAAAAVALQVLAPAGATSGAAFDVTILAVDPYGNIDTHYAGTVTFTTSDTDPAVVLPVDYVFSAADGGTHTFSGGFTLVTPGDQTLTAADLDGGFSASLTLPVNL
jgi:hypothetical protein